MDAPLYAVSLTLFADSNTCDACVPYTCWNILIGKVFPEAPVSIFSRNVHSFTWIPSGLILNFVYASSRVIVSCLMMSRLFELKVTE